MRRVSAFLLLALALALGVSLSPAPLTAQQGDFALLRVRVVDAATNKPISGARVGYPEIKLFTLTDKNCIAEIAKVPPGERSLEVTMLGYGTATTTMTLGANLQATGDIALKTDPIHIDGITVASAPSTTKIKRDPKLISSIELAEPAVHTLNAYQAIQRLRPSWLRARPKKTFVKPSLSPNHVPGEPTPTDPDQFPAIIVDGTIRSGHGQASSPQDMDAISALLSAVQVPGISDIQMMSASDATTRYGTGFPNGAIVITTLAR
jgi:hypothetical protein